jgi:hypothetical protein
MFSMKKSTFFHLSKALSQPSIVFSRIGKAFAMTLLILLATVSSYATITITLGSGGSNICADKAVGGVNEAFTTLGDITIAEGAVADFTSDGSLTLSAPSGWAFNTAGPVPTISVTGTGIAASASWSGGTLVITRTLTLDNLTNLNSIVISGLSVKPNTAGAAAGQVRRTAVSGTWNNITASTNFASLSVAPLPPAISLSQNSATCGGSQISAGGASGATIYFQGTVSGGTSTATALPPAITVPALGTYYFRARTALGCWGTEASIVVTSINPTPSDVTVTSTATPVCGSATLTATGGTGGTIYYHGTNGASTSITTPSTTQVVSVSGTYYFRARTSVGCWGTAEGITVTINPIPTAVTVSGGGTSCGTATLTATGGTGGTIFYQGTTSGGTDEASGGSPQVVSSTGTYYFRSKSAAGCWGTEGSASVTINPNAGAVTASGGGTFCGSTTITASGGAGGTIYFQGTTSGGTSTATPSSSQLVSTSGTYYFRAQTAAGCWGPEGSVTVTINPAAGAVTVSGGGSFCASTTITASGGTGGTIYFQGTTSGGTSIATPSTSELIATSGTYFFRAQTAAGCWGTEGSANVTISSNPGAVTAAGGGTFCNSATITASGGTGGTIYFQGTTSGGTSTTTISSSEVVTSSGTYYFRAQNAGGCWGTEGSVTVSINPNPAAVTASGGGTFCNSATITASGGAGGTIYFQGTTSGGTSTATISSSEVVTTSGTYYFRAQTAAGCWGTEGSVNVTITSNPGAVTAAGGGTFCNSATITASGGTGGTIYFQGTTSGGTSTATISSSEVVTSSGTYYFRAQNAGGCWGAEGSVTVSINPNPAAVTASGGGTFCNSATITASGGAGGTIYFQGTTSGGTSTATISSSEVVTSSGTYYFRAQTAAGCWGTEGSVTVTINPNAGAVTASGGGTFCNSATITASGGTGGTIYFQGTTSGGTSTATISSSEVVTSSGTYYFRAQTAAGCWGTEGSVTVTINPNAGAVTASGGGTFCNSATITASGGTGGTIYFQGTTSGGTSTATISSSEVVTSSGTYYFRAQTAAGCWGTEGSVTVTINPNAGAVTASGGGTFCNSATITASGGTGGTIYFQGTTSGGTSTATISSSEVVTSSGTYYFRAQTAAGCWGTEGSVTVTINPNAGAVTASGGGTFCNSATITASGGTGGTIYFQGTTSGGTSTATISSSEVVTSSGTYFFRAQTAAGCWGTQGSVTVSINPNPGAVTASGGGTFCNSTTITASGGTGGTIYFQGTTSGGTSTATISSSEVVTSSGTYYFRAQTAAGCWGTEGSVTVTINPNAGAVTASGGGTFCNSATITASGGTGGTIYFQGTTSGGTSTATISSSEVVTTSGTYYFRAQTAAGCWGTEGSVAVTINPNPAAVTVSGGGSFCNNTTITASGGAGGTIYFQGTTSGGTSTATPSTSQNITSSGTYYFRAQTALGCWGTEGSVTVTINPNAGAVTVAGGGTFCNTATITASGGSGGTIFYQGTTSGGTSTAVTSSSEVITTTGTYYFRAQTALGCWGTQGSAAVTINPNPAAVTVSGGGTFCNNTTITASGGIGGTIYFQGTTSGGTSTTTPSTSENITSSGTYYFRAQTALGCWGAEGSVTVTINPNAGAVTVSGAGAFCDNTTLTATGGSGGTIFYQGTTSGGTSTAVASTSENVTASGTYYFRARTALGCWGTQGSAIVTINPNPAAVTVSGGGTFCNSTLITAADGTGGTIYFQGTTSGGTSTATPSTSENITASGTYYFRSQSAAGCWGPQGSVSVTINPNAGAVTVSGAGTFCNNTTITATGGSGGTIYFQGTTSGGTSIATPSVSENITTSGTYFFRAQTALGCWGTQGSVAVTINPNAGAVTASGGGTFCNNTTITASGGSGGTIYFQGTTSGGTSVATPSISENITSSGTYYFRAQTALGCWGAEGSVSVTINPNAGAVTAAGAGTFCNNTTITASGGSGGTIFFQGTTSGGTSTATPSTSEVITSSGTYYFRARTAAGCWGTEGSVTVTINPNAGAVTASGAGTFCNNTTITASGGSGGTIFFQGTTSGGTSTATPSVSENITSSGTYYFRARTAAGCWGTEGSVAVTINPNAGAVTASGGGTFCNSATITASGGSGGTIYFQGTTSGGTSTATISSSEVVTSSGTYYFRAQTAAGCWGTEGSVTVVINPNAGAVTVSGGGTFCNSTLVTATGGSGGTIYFQGTTSGGTSTVAPSLSEFITSSGTYYFRAQTAAGCWGTEGSVAVTINPNAGAVTASGGGTFCNSATITASGGSGGTIYFQGTTSGGTSTATISSSEVVTSSGTYYFRAQTAAGCWGTEGSVTVVINPNAGAVTVSGGGTFCNSTLVTATGGSGGTIYFQGTTSGGTSTVAPSLSEFITSSGTYYFRAQTAAGCWGTQGSVSVTINPNAGAVTASGGGTFCNNATITASGGSGGSIYFQGTTSGGTSTATLSSSQVVSASGTYYFRAQTAAGCWGPEGSVSVTINPNAGAVTASGGGTFCNSTTITASGGSGGTIYFQGTTSGGTSTATPSTSQSITTSGTYYFRAQTALGCWGTEGSVSVVINPNAGAVTVSGGGAYCTSTVLTATGGSGGTIYFQGTTSGGTSVATPSSSQLISSSGTYYFRAQTAAGCWGTQGSATVTLGVLPAVYTMTGGGSTCVGSGTSFAIGLNGSDAGVNYQLYNGVTPVGAPVVGTGSALSFGTHSTDGTYTIVAEPGTSCQRTMTGSAVIFVAPNPIVYNVTGGGTICQGSVGTHIGLDWSVLGVNYQLYRGATAVGSPVPGSTSALDFGLITVAGTYTVVATNATLGCTSNMAGSATINVNPAPTAYTVTGGGTTCPGTGAISVGLSNSELNTTYQLYNGSSATGSPVSGLPGVITFGSQNVSGIYTVLATNTITGCTGAMSSFAAVNILPAPTPYTVSGGGTYCAGGSGFAILLSNSNTGIHYQLYNGSTPVGAPLAGTGSILSFGTQTAAGTYSVLGTNTVTACVGDMNGTASIVVNALPTVYAVTGGGQYCAGGSGVPIGLSFSATGINYQLYNGSTPTGSPVAGTGSAISFGNQTSAGTYTVFATNGTTSCTNNMSGSVAVTVNPLPPLHNVTGSGSYCQGGAGLPVGLDGSEVGISYQLYNGVSVIGTPVAGTGSAISFGIQATAGSYTVLATDATSTCTRAMTGAATIVVNPLPTIYVVTGGGHYCAGGTGVDIGLASSSLGISYQLYNGTTATGSPVAGTGSAISFGLQTVSGSYTVGATNTVTACYSGMFGSTVVVIDPLPTQFAVTGGGAYCAGGTGVTVGMAFTNTGINYQLYNGSTLVGGPVAGTGVPITFGTYTAAGTYSVLATNSITSCTRAMTGSATIVINPLPVAQIVTGGGTYCENGSGVTVGLNTSENSTISYQLYNGTTATGSPVAGVSGALTFGLQTAAGTYSVRATNTGTGCVNGMTGTATVIVNPAPTAYNVTGGGSYCAGGSGVAVGLSNSNIGITYQLYDGATAIGSPVFGTGVAISFGQQFTAATYTVLATNSATLCTHPMTGSATVIVNALPTAFAMNGGGSYCSGGTGVTMGVAGSQTGINYQLYRGATSVGSPVAGTGASISFGLQTVAGTYSVLATNTTTGCTKAMSTTKTVIVNALPAIFAVYGGGGYCSGSAGAHIGILGSETGINYQLMVGGSPVGSVMPGSGAGVDFGEIFVPATYTVRATNMFTGCISDMTGSATVIVNTPPSAFAVTGGGNHCAGSTGNVIGLSGSQSGVNYRLYIGAGAVGSMVSGTGSAITFGPQTTAGTYTVLATNATSGCTTAMTGSTTVIVNAVPSAYTVLGGGSYCPGDGGVNITLSSSNIGITYQVYRGATAVGSAITGTGGAINLGAYTTVGSYSATATNVLTGCTSNMTGSVSVGTYTLPTAFTITGGGNYCAGGSGLAVGLSGSQSGVTYQLYNGASIISTLPGTGSSLDFGAQSSAGTYSVKATNNTTGCINTMTGSAAVVVDALPINYLVTGGGNYCAGGTGFSVTLNGSNTGISYQLYRGTTAVGAPVAGTGTFISYGLQTVAGFYSVKATNITSGCSRIMTGTPEIVVHPLPVVYSVTGGGSYCSGGTGLPVGIAGSSFGIDYRLFNGSVPVGSAISGLGTALNLGIHTAAGTYTVQATNPATGCVSNMTGTATIVINPTPAAYTVTGGGNFCEGGTGVNVGLSWSASGVAYRLYRGSIAVGTPVTGTNSPLDFGLMTTPGVYSVSAVNTSTTCSNSMSGTVTVSVNPNPTVFNITGGGAYCAGTAGAGIALSSSQTGVTYTLYSGSTPVGTPIAGTGATLDFGPNVAGTYTIRAVNDATSCQSTMNGSVDVTVNAAPVTFVVTGGGTHCASGAGVLVGLSGSESGINYALYNDGVATGISVAGTGAAISFGLQATAGLYTVQAANATTSCAAAMSGSATIVVNPLPVVYNVTGGGTYCAGGAGASVDLSGSNTGIIYQLYKNGVATGSVVTGTGFAVSFGPQFDNGTYTVKAVNSTTSCTIDMTGSAVVSTTAVPTAFSVTGGGSFCDGGTGVNVGLGGSVTGVNYQLYIGTMPVGAVVAGTGFALSFGDQTMAGTYIVKATDASTSCTASMSGTAAVVINPLPVAQSVTGGGGFCAGGSGVHIGLGSSEINVTYTLYNGAVPVGTSFSGTGGAVDMGLFTGAGIYSVSAVNNITGCSAAMVNDVTVINNPLPAAQTVVGGGAYCAGGAGVDVAMSGSEAGVNYQLYNGSVAVGAPVAGTDDVLSFGFQTAAGTYNVVGVNAATGCTSAMISDATVVVNALPLTYTVGGGGNYCTGGTGVNITLSGSQSGITYRLYNGTVQSGSDMAGTGSTLDFGFTTGAGSYTAMAVNTATGCTAAMAGSATVGTHALPTVYNVSTGASYCVGGTGVHVTLNGSQAGVTYRLYNGSTLVGSAVAGTGSILDFGLQTAGVYTVSATDNINSCTTGMAGTSVITTNALPFVFSMTGGGGYCSDGAGAVIGLSGSQIGVSYRLYRGTTEMTSPILGNGSPLNFGSNLAGTYSVTASFDATGCSSNMTGTATISVHPQPNQYDVTGGGSYCAGGTGVGVTLSGSQIGVNYRLYRGTLPVGSPVAGTGGTLSFGNQIAAGDYTVIATNATTTCTRSMAGAATVVINNLPVVYTISGGGSYCAGGTGVNIGLMGSQTGVSYQLMSASAAIGAPVEGTGSDISFGLHTNAGSYTIKATDITTGCTANMSGAASVAINGLPNTFALTSSASGYCVGGAGVILNLGGSQTGVSYRLYNSTTALGAAIAGSGGSINFGAQTLAGAYVVVGTNTVTGCTATMTGSPSIAIHTLPLPNMVSSGGSYCADAAGVEITMTTTQAGINYQLYKGSAIQGSPVAGTGSSISFGVLPAGSYTVRATDAVTGCRNHMFGTAVVAENPLPTVYAVTGGGQYCEGGTGHSIGLAGSAIGVQYTLYNGATMVGSAVNGTGGSIDFGTQTAAGTYTVTALNTVTTCGVAMSGSATISINNLPANQTITGGGAYCAGGTGVSIGLAASQAGVNYRLYNGSSAVGSAVAGGGVINFGTFTAAGTYTVRATNATTACWKGMTGSATVVVNALPGLQTVAGGGNYCAGGTGVAVGLVNSASGVNYRLYMGSTALATATGTGGPLSFGSQTVAGTYTVLATDALTGCTRAMTGTAVVGINAAVIPSVMLTASNDTVCAGNPVMFTTVAANAGTTPGYQWKVNGTVVATTGDTYMYTPANGDVVTVVLASSAACADPLTASDAATVTVLENRLPAVVANLSSGDTLCEGTAVTFTAESVFGGDAPLFSWLKNGVVTASGPVFTYTPVSGDVIAVSMTSNFRCRLATVVTGENDTMKVIIPEVPVVNITANPGLSIAKGQSLTLTAGLTHSYMPTYQWYLNGGIVVGATNATFTYNEYIDGDSVTVRVVNNTPCGEFATSQTVGVAVSNVGVVNVGTSSFDITLMPNPTKGAFVIKGTLAGMDDKEVAIEITDMLGQVVYRGTAAVAGKAINERIQLDGALANGIYIVNVRAASASKTFHLVLQQ